jgi:hypothetical protein
MTTMTASEGIFTHDHPGRSVKTVWLSLTLATRRTWIARLVFLKREETIAQVVVMSRAGWWL